MDHSLLKFKNLEDILNATGGAVSLLRSSSTGPYVFPIVPPEFTNWRERTARLAKHVRPFGHVVSI